MNGPARPGVLRVGDRVLFEEAEHQVVGIEGTTVRLLAADGRPWLVALPSWPIAGFRDRRRGCAGQGPGLPPFGLLEPLPEHAAARPVSGSPASWRC